MSQENYKVEVLYQEISDFELSFKIIIIGDSGVGKSCLSLRATKNVFEELYSPTTLPHFGHLWLILQQQGFLFEHIWTQQYNKLKSIQQKQAKILNFDSVIVVIASPQ